MAVPSEPAASATPPAELRRFAINFHFLSGGEFTTKLLTFASFAYLALVLGPLS